MDRRQVNWRDKEGVGKWLADRLSCFKEIESYYPDDLTTDGRDFSFLPDELNARTIWSKETKQTLLIFSATVFIVFSSIFYLWGIAGCCAAVSLVGASFYIFSIFFRLGLFLVSISEKRENLVAGQDIREFKNEELPWYTILVPLYKESKSIPGLIQSLQKIDWPKDKLDIKFIVEEDDAPLRDYLAKIDLPIYISVNVAPKADKLKGKPRALNSVLKYARGEHLTIYDVEDRPDASQLKIAYGIFEKSDDRLVCLQARLDYYNENRNILTRWFTAEYAVWFGYLLPALGALGLPMPLGGTSNHFKTDFLKRIGGWDPYNVTEDCEIGMRIYRVKSRMGSKVFASETKEEATAHLGNWMRQRSRWIKGFLETFIAHFRYPLQAIRDFGFKGFIIFLFMTLGIGIGHLINIFFWTLFAIWIFGGAPFLEWFFPPWLLYAHFFTLIFGNAILILMHVVVALLERRYVTAIVSIFIPIYWMLMAVANIKAIYQLFTSPHYWEKTEHFGDENS